MTGIAQIVDGDTLRIDGQRLRLVGLDAPEIDQQCTGGDGRDWGCGAAAAAALARLVGGKPIACTRSGTDQFGRGLVTCLVGGANVGGQLVAAGWAVADGDYLAEQETARTAGLGIWSGQFTLPVQWRRDHGSGAPGVWQWIRSWFQ